MEPLMWLIVLAVFLVIEAITVGLTTIWFAGGALVAAIASGAGAGILGAVDPVFSHFTGPTDFYKTTGSSIYE